MEATIRGYMGFLREEKYVNGRLAVLVVRGFTPIATLSINIPHIELEPNEFVLNHDVRLEDIKCKWIVDTGKRVCYGWVVDQPVLKLVKGK